MAVERTGAIYKSLYFDGEDSRDYGVYITGEAVYNAPEREVEMISIPGRSGQLALDKGRFENIEVTYPAGIYADNEADFAEAISDFRNLLCSRRGYVRLQDEYHPNEYRMAVYKSGLEVDNAMLRAGEFEIVFDCKPQRYLTSGEEPIDVDSSDVISNPTLFESSPLLEVTGYGDIDIGGKTISLENVVYGDIDISPAVSFKTKDYSLDLNMNRVADGDTVTVPRISLRSVIRIPVAVTGNQTITHSNASFTSDWEWTGRSLELVFYVGFTYELGTATTITDTATITITGTNSTTYTVILVATISVTADGDIAITRVTQSVPNTHWLVRYTDSASRISKITADSTKSVLGEPTYIDCDYGEAYKDEDGEIAVLNKYIDLGSDLPKLGTGATTVTFDNTVTDLKIHPNWWKV